MPQAPCCRPHPARAAAWLAAAALALAAVPAGAPASPGAADADTVVVLAADAWPPYNCAADDSLAGYMIDVARAALEPHGYRVEYRIVPWQRALAGTRSGDYDGAVGASPVEAEGLVLPATELLRSRSTFFVRTGTAWRFAGPASLDTVTLGAIDGYDYVGWLNDYIVQHDDDPARVQAITGDYPLRQNLRKLAAGRVDVIVGDPGSVTYTARGIGLADDLVRAGHAGGEVRCTIAFSPATARGRRLAELLDAGVAALRRDGRLAAILARYGLVDWLEPGDRP